jgi:hypothetical protein
MRVGKNQIDILVVLASPMYLAVPGPECKGLIARGLLREREPGGYACITPLGLRVLADEMEAGRVNDALERMRKNVEKRQAESAAKEIARK